jgi:hypothetical protein
MAGETKNDGTAVPVETKNFIGVGKIVFDSNAEWNIPHLHFMVDKTASGNYEATLLEFGLVSWAETKNDSIIGLAGLTHSHILAVMERSGFDQFIEDVGNDAMESYWREYRKIEFSLARTGKDLSHEMDSQLARAMKGMISEKTERLIEDMAKGYAEEIVEKFKRRLSVTPSTLSYTELEAA